jgi:hypothetical protein
MIGIVIVDGTGTDFIARNNDQYKVDYDNSACSRISRMFPATTYQRGPRLDGFDMGACIEEAYKRALAFAGMFGRGCEGLCLIGHSRGGAAVIAVAHRLKEKGIDVGFMGLFDAVEMDSNFRWDVDRIPANVKCVYHSERKMLTLSRHLWGNCGDSWDGGQMKRQLLWGTHGSIGGVPPGRPPDNPRPPDQLIWEAGCLFPTRVTVAEGQKAADDAWDFIVNQGLRPALARMSAEPEKPGEKPGTGPGNGNGGEYPGGGKPGGGNPGGGDNGNPYGRTYVVVRGDSLSLISGKFYGDVLLWPVIYDANKQVVGSNPNLIQPNQRLAIPPIGGYSKGQLDGIRQRGRNC